MGRRRGTNRRNHDQAGTEFDLLERLTRWPGRVFTREELLDAVRGGETEAFDRAVDRHVSNLRAKIEADPKKPDYLHPRRVGAVPNSSSMRSSTASGRTSRA